MSLTSLLQTYEGSNVLKPLMRSKPDGLHAGMAAPPQTRHYMKAGTAFDYLMRWHIEHQYRQKTETRNTWVAEEGAELVWNGYCSKTGRTESLVWRDNMARGIGFPDGTTEDDMRRAAERAMRLLDDGKTEHERYMHTGRADCRTAVAVLGLTTLDAVLRANRAERLISGDIEPDHGDITDMLNLHESLERSETMHAVLDAARCIRLNPTFGKYSAMVGGADADIIADDTLIDIKTTKSPTYKPDYWQQLLGYCALANASRGRRERIRRLGIYFSRFGVLRVVDAPDADWPSIAKKLADAWGSLLDGTSRGRKF